MIHWKLFGYLLLPALEERYSHIPLGPYDSALLSYLERNSTTGINLELRLSRSATLCRVLPDIFMSPEFIYIFICKQSLYILL